MQLELNPSCSHGEGVTAPPATPRKRNKSSAPSARKTPQKEKTPIQKVSAKRKRVEEEAAEEPEEESTPRVKLEYGLAGREEEEEEDPVGFSFSELHNGVQLL